MNKNLQKYKQVDDKYECPKCGKLYSKFGIGIHTWRAHGDGKEFAPKPRGTYNGVHQIWNKGLNKNNSRSIQKGINTLKQKIQSGEYKPHRTKHSKKTKYSLSIKRKKFLSENPEKHPWKKHTKFISEPCEHFKNILRQKGIEFIEEFQPLLPERFFSIDVALIHKRIGVEINGNFHYNGNNKNNSLKDYYKNRHQILESAGWTIYEIHYLDVYDNNKMTDLLSRL